jgi:hypothetical protein
MNLPSRSLLRVLSCTVALAAVSVLTVPAGAAPPDDAKPAQRGHAHGGHHRHLSPRQKVRLGRFLHNHPGALKQLRERHGGHAGKGHHRGHAAPATPSVN